MISTRQVAKRLGLSAMALSRYIAQGKIPEPKRVMLGGMRIHDWTEEEIEHVRKLLPKIKNGRKTRYLKKHSAVSNQQKQRKRKPRSKTHNQRDAPVKSAPNAPLTKSPSRRQYG